MLPAGTVPSGAPPEAPPRSDLTERATVELVLIEAYVTDTRGRPLRDLTVDNFSLSVDGHARPIHSLEFRDGTIPPLPAAGQAPAGGEDPLARRLPSTLPRR